MKVEAENPLTGEYHHTASAYVTMVSLDSHGRPTKMAGVEPETDIQKQRFEAAVERRKTRLQLKKNLEERRKKHEADK